jgi:hypothetical protein
MKKKIGEEIDESNYDLLHSAFINFLESFQPLLDIQETIHQDLVVKSMLDESEEIKIKLETMEKLDHIFSKVMIPYFFKIGHLEEKLLK